jgi:DNA-binding CsgD family transcriptional regulator
MQWKAPPRTGESCNHSPVETQVHQAMSVMGRVAQVAGEQGAARDRGAEVLEELRRLIPFEAAELTTFNPIDGSVEEIFADGYDQEVLDGLRSERFLELMYSLGLPDSGMPVRMKDLPGDMYDNWAVSELLLPAGYAEGMTMALRTPDGRFTGVLNLSTTTKEHPSDIARAAMAQLCTALGNLADPVRSGRWLAMLLGAESMAVGLDHAGGIVRLPGISTHPLLDDGSDLVETAQVTAGRLQTWSSFVWPDEDDWYRVRIVPCRADQHLCAVLSIDEVSLGALSRREIEVLTLAAEGMSNSEIGDALVISSRTVGTHIEHILEKVGAPNRAAAVAHAIREGLVLGRVQRYDLL